MAHTYGISEVVGTSTTSIDDAISAGGRAGLDHGARAGLVRGDQIRGHLADGAVAHYQVGLKLGSASRSDWR